METEREGTKHKMSEIIWFRKGTVKFERDDWEGVKRAVGITEEDEGWEVWGQANGKGVRKGDTAVRVEKSQI